MFSLVTAPDEKYRIFGWFSVPSMILCVAPRGLEDPKLKETFYLPLCICLPCWYRWDITVNSIWGRIVEDPQWVLVFGTQAMGEIPGLGPHSAIWEKFPGSLFSTHRVLPTGRFSLSVVLPG
jgi:hypothetical protein